MKTLGKQKKKQNTVWDKMRSTPWHREETKLYSDIKDWLSKDTYLRLF